MRGLKVLLGSTALLVGMGLALAPAANAQVYVSIGVQPVCSYGYYGYAPYQCAPMGYYGPGYFYNGIFLGMGPWGGWGYSHGWGGHRFSGEGGGSYHGGPGAMSYRSGGAVHSSSVRGSAAVSHGGGARPSAGRAVVSHSSGGGQARGGGGGQAHGGGGQAHGGGGQGHGGGGHK